MRDRSQILRTCSPRSDAPLSIRELTPAFSDRSGTHHEYRSERANGNPRGLSNGQLRAAVHVRFLEPEPAHSKARDRVSRHSGSAGRIVIAKIDGRSIQLWRTRIVWRTRLAA